MNCLFLLFVVAEVSKNHFLRWKKKNTTLPTDCFALYCACRAEYKYKIMANILNSTSLKRWMRRKNQSDFFSPQLENWTLYFILQVGNLGIKLLIVIRMDLDGLKQPPWNTFCCGGVTANATSVLVEQWNCLKKKREKFNYDLLTSVYQHKLWVSVLVLGRKRKGGGILSECYRSQIQYEQLRNVSVDQNMKRNYRMLSNWCPNDIALVLLRTVSRHIQQFFFVKMQDTKPIISKMTGLTGEAVSPGVTPLAVRWRKNWHLSCMAARATGQKLRASRASQECTAEKKGGEHRGEGAGRSAWGEEGCSEKRSCSEGGG